MEKEKRNWTGYTVVIPDQHSLIIIGPWKEESPDMWWWKCGNCTESSGVMSTIELDKLYSKGRVIDPGPDAKLPSQHSMHPKERALDEYEDYSMYGY